MRHEIYLVGVAILLAGCVQLTTPNDGERPLDAEQGPHIRPVARPDGISVAAKPPETARTVEQFDTTSRADREAAQEAAEEAKDSGAGKVLGRTVVSLGDPGQPGFWIKTPLVSAAGQGRVVSLANGKAVQVDLIPIDGPKTAGSRMSLAALRLIEAGLTDLTEVEVFLD